MTQKAQIFANNILMIIRLST